MVKDKGAVYLLLPIAFEITLPQLSQQSLHDSLYSAAQCRQMDAQVAADLNIEPFELMQRAAKSALNTLLQNYPSAGAISVWCGKGNNGGDAYLLAAYAKDMGLEVQLVAVEDVALLSGDAQQAYHAAVEAGLIPSSNLEIVQADVVVDGLLGTGLNRAPAEHMSAAIDHINNSGLPILSIDVPSGVNASTGDIPGICVQADSVVTFIAHKIGLHTGPGCGAFNHMNYDSLGAAVKGQGGLPLVKFNPAQLPKLDTNTYKHQQGHVVVVGGDRGMPGAVVLASQAALRCGAGLVTCLTHGEHAQHLIARQPEIMVGDLSRAQQVLEQATIVVLGPGLGRLEWGEKLFELVQQITSSRNIPCVLDADGLFWLAQAKQWCGGPLYITPHTAEAARLLDCDVVQVQKDRLAAAQTLQKQFDCCGVLKGAGSVLFTPHDMAVCGHGNAGMATAGMGDVLSGIAGGLLAQAPTADASTVFVNAVCLHSAAADVAADQFGQRSLLASDVVDCISDLLKSSG